MTHVLKLNGEYLENILIGNKKSVVVINDKDYQKDDIVHFADYAKSVTKYHVFYITHIHSGEGLKENYVVLSLAYVKTE